jgi:hypothetical protein
MYSSGPFKSEFCVLDLSFFFENFGENAHITAQNAQKRLEFSNAFLGLKHQGSQKILIVVT